eukprot:6814215-Prymnesium_polylepis.1
MVGALSGGTVYTAPHWLSGAQLRRLRDATAAFATSSDAASSTRRYASRGVHARAIDLLAEGVWPRLPPPLLEL